MNFLQGLKIKKIIRLFIIVFILFNISLCPVWAAGKAEKAADIEGRIRISGAWALYPMVVKWAEEFKKVYPNVRIDISAGGAGKGMTDALSGLVDIGMVSRELRPEELKQNAFYIPVVKDAVFPTINAANPVMKELAQRGLKKRDFVKLWLTGQQVTWGELAQTNNGRNVRVYTRSDSCGAAETWARYLGAQQEDLKGVAVYGDPGVADAIRKDKDGIGYNNLNFAYDMKTGMPVAGIQAVPIDVNENGRVDLKEKLGTKEEAIKAVLSGVYPSPPARDLYLVTKGNFSGLAKEFVQWILSEGQKYVDEVGYLKIDDSQIRDAQKKLAIKK